MKSFLFGLVIGIIIPVTGFFYFNHPDVDNNVHETVTQVSGEKIDHTDYNYKGKSVTFKTQSEGKGEIKTEIPKLLIPEAAAWIQKNNIIQADVMYMYHDSLFLSYSLSYYRRFGVMAFGGGIIAGGESLGLRAGILYLF